MTCEIAILNRSAVALAADRAVTVDDGKKIFTDADKIFQLHPDTPVAVMIYGCAEMMGVPWRVIVNSYASALGSRKFGTLREYAKDFLGYVEKSRTFFPDEHQREWFTFTVESYWRNLFLNKPSGKAKKRRTRDLARAERLLAQDHARWSRFPAMEHLGADYGREIANVYVKELSALKTKFLKENALSSDVGAGLVATAEKMFSQKWFAPDDRGFVVFAGLGEAEAFPGVIDFQIGSVTAGKLRYCLCDERYVTVQDSAFIAPFAQSNVIDLFYRGIAPEVEERLCEMVGRTVASKLESSGIQVGRKAIQSVRREIRKNLAKEIEAAYSAPQVAALDPLSGDSLAEAAETLVSLTVLRKHLSMDEQETVGGKVDVAVLSKGNGFRWVKRHSRLLGRTQLQSSASL